MAIKSTVGALCDAVGEIEDRPIYGSRVEYVDYSATFIPEGNLYYPITYKRLSFEFEKEYRLLSIWWPRSKGVDERNVAIPDEPDVPPLFLRRKVALQSLIESVNVSPLSPQWIVAAIRDASRHYLPDVEVRQSELADGPIW